MIREVEFMPQARAECFRTPGREGIISITGSGHPGAKLRKGWFRVLRLVFDDVERPRRGGVPFDAGHAAAILAWLDAVEGKVERVFVHCHAGKHRSASVAKFIAERYDLSGLDRGYPYDNRRACRVLWRQWRKRRSGSGE